MRSPANRLIFKCRIARPSARLWDYGQVRDAERFRSALPLKIGRDEEGGFGHTSRKLQIGEEGTSIRRLAI